MSTDDEKQLESILWDAVVVGTGMGGGTVGHALAKAGRKVLFLEKGLSYHTPGDQPFPDRMPEEESGYLSLTREDKVKLLRRGGRSVDAIEDISRGRQVDFRPFIGSGTGGSSALFGMVMERFYPSDFSPRQYQREVGDSSIVDEWPIRYDELRPWYAAAERLYRVHGTHDPLRPNEVDEALLSPPPFTPSGQELFDYFQGQGLHPYHLHLACDHVPECRTCQGVLCSQDCKNDSAKICVGPAVNQHGARVLSDCAVERLEADRAKVTRILCRWRGRDLSVRGKTVLLGAGALFTPALLLKSTSKDWPTGIGNDNDWVGRNLMRHCIDLLAVTPKSKEPILRQTKELCLNDFYYRDGLKMGSLQSFGLLPPMDYLVSMPGWIPRVLHWARPLIAGAWEKQRQKSVALAAQLEDLPYLDNRVLPANGNAAEGGQAVRLQYRLHDAEKVRLKVFRESLNRLLKPYRPVMMRNADDNTGIAHVCGTCRFGHDPKRSVLNPDNRVHGVENLYVVDASFFPSSAGINPSLTIAANALRVADVILKST
ncbi:MAG: GMC family oxidoreductase [Planctomycetota bacterium]